MVPEKITRPERGPTGNPHNFRDHHTQKSGMYGLPVLVLVIPHASCVISLQQPRHNAAGTTQARHLNMVVCFHPYCRETDGDVELCAPNISARDPQTPNDRAYPPKWH
jgi:hypothetical protein